MIDLAHNPSRPRGGIPRFLSLLLCIVFGCGAAVGWQSTGSLFWEFLILSLLSGAAVILRLGWAVPCTLLGFLVGLWLQDWEPRRRLGEPDEMIIRLLGGTFSGLLTGLFLELALRRIRPAADVNGGNPGHATRTAAVLSSRPLLVVGLLIWVSLAWTVWDRIALLQPYATVPIADGSRLRSFSRSGHVIVHAQRALGSKSFASYGPIALYSARDGSKLFETFSETDQIFSLEVSPDTVTVIRRGAETWLADLETGDILHRLPEDDTRPQFHYRRGDQSVVFMDDDGLRCYDVVAGGDVWRYATGRLKMIEAMTPTHVLLFEQSAATGKEQSVAIRLSDGELEDKIGPPGSYSIHEHSADGRFLVIRKPHKTAPAAEVVDFEVFDTVLQKLIPLMKSVPGSSAATLAFSPDSTEIRRLSFHAGRLQMQQMRLVDGGSLDGGPYLTPRGVTASGYTSVSHDHRWALHSRTVVENSTWRSIQQVCGSVWKFFGQKYTQLPPPVETSLHELPSGRCLGVIAREWPPTRRIGPASRGTHVTWLSPKSDCFVIQHAGENVAQLYSPQPSRSWHHLMAIAAGPPIALALLLWLSSKRRRTEL